MKERNVLSSSKGYVERIIGSYEAVELEQVRKYFLSTLRFARYYLEEGATVFTVNKKVAEMRKVKKSHRGAVEYDVDHSKKKYNRYRGEE